MYINENYTFFSTMKFILFVFCAQMTSNEHWLPEEAWSGRVAQREMLLGPFFAVSGLMEDSAEVKRDYTEAAGEGDYTNLATTLQQRLSICRVSGWGLWGRG